MLQVCIFSGHEGTLDSEGKVYITLMGGCELRSPSIARQVVRRMEREARGMPQPPKQVFVTLMGATEIKVPTLVEELIDLRDALGSGRFTLADWDRYALDGSRLDVSFVTYSLMAGFSDGELPSEDEEIDALAMQRHLGSITQEVGDLLKLGIGQHGGERRSIIRRAVVAAGA